MAIHPFSALSLDELKANAARTNDLSELRTIHEYVRDHRNTRAARAFQRDLERRLELIEGGQAPAAAAPRPIGLGGEQPELSLEQAGPPRQRRDRQAPKFPPTDEQIKARDAFMRGDRSRSARSRARVRPARSS
jgi:hypothetical protein